MAIISLDGYIGGTKQILSFCKLGTAATTVANQWHTLFDRIGYPSAGTLDVGNTANGLVPTDATVGFPPIINFSGSNKGYLSRVMAANTVAGRFLVYDRLFHAGDYAFNDAVTLASQPSYLSRVPGGSYVGTELWVEIVTSMTGALNIAVTYTNQDGTTGRTTGTVALESGAITGRMFRLPLQSGDVGIAKIDSVTGTVASAGTFNVVVLRPLFECRVDSAAGGSGMVYGLDTTGMLEVFASSALQVAFAPDGTSSGAPDVYLEVVEG